ncbi:MAG: restriction endonuclease [Candidatus Binatia bacterium]
MISKDIAERTQTVDESKKNLEANTSLNNKISACHAIIKVAEALLKYEKNEIPTGKPLPSALLLEYSAKKNGFEDQKKKDNLILESLKSKAKEARSKAGFASNYKEKFVLISAALAEVRTYKNQVSGSEVLTDLERELENFIRELSTFSALLTYAELKHPIQDLQRLIAAAKGKNEPLPHLLLCGSFEPGTASLAREISREMGVNIRYTSAAVIEGSGDLAALLTNLDEGHIILIEQIELMNKVVLQGLLSALADFQIDIMIGQGPAARSIQLPVKLFTLIGTTRNSARVDRSLRRLMAVYNFTDAKPVLGCLLDYVGQEAIKKDLRARIDTARRNSQRLPHLLLCGPREIGKATLAGAIANEMQTSIQSSDAASLDRPEDLEDLLISLQAGGLSIVERIDLLKEPIVEALVQVLENPSVAITMGEGSSVRNVGPNVELKYFTLIGTTSRPSQVNKRLRRWMIVYDFAPYSVHEIGQMLQLIAKQENISVEPEAADLLAKYCEGSPGNARVLMKRLLEYTRTNETERVSLNLTREALVSFGYLATSATSLDLANKLCAMSRLDFEEFVARAFREMGYSVEITPISGDHGIDLLMRKDHQLVVVQCKRWNASIGEPVIREFYGSLMGAGAQSGYIITTGAFTSQAYSFVQDKPIQLVDLDALINLVNSKR